MRILYVEDDPFVNVVPSTQRDVLIVVVKDGAMSEESLPCGPAIRVMTEKSFRVVFFQTLPPEASVIVRFVSVP